MLWQSPEKPWQAPKIILKYAKLIRQKLLPYGRLKFLFLRDLTFQVLVRGSSFPKKT